MAANTKRYQYNASNYISPLSTLPAKGLPSPNDIETDDDIQISDDNNSNDNQTNVGNESGDEDIDLSNRKNNNRDNSTNNSNSSVPPLEHHNNIDNGHNNMNSAIDQQHKATQQYLSTKEGTCFVAKETISGAKQIPQGTVGCIVARKEKPGEYCAVFVKPYDNAEYAITDPNSQLSFS